MTIITVDNDNVFDMVNDNIQDIKNHLKDINIDVKDVVIAIKSNDENLFSDNFNRGFNQERNFKQGKNNNYKKNNEDSIDDVIINEYSNDNDNLNILIYQPGHGDACPPLHDPGDLFFRNPVPEDAVFLLQHRGLFLGQTLPGLGELAVLQLCRLFQIVAALGLLDLPA